MADSYGRALLDWMACAFGGREERAAVAARAAGTRPLDGLLDDPQRPAADLPAALSPPRPTA